MDKAHAVTIEGSAVRVSSRVLAMLQEILAEADLIDRAPAVFVDLRAKAGSVSASVQLIRAPRRVA